MPKTPKEKRHFFRHPLSMPLALEIAGEKLSARFFNISFGGLCFRWPSRLSRGSLISLHIPVKEKHFDVKARVAYSRILNGSHYETGVAFIDAPSAFRIRLAEEILQIIKYQKQQSRKLGYELSEEEAAKKWIKKNATKFPKSG